MSLLRKISRGCCWKCKSLPALENSFKRCSKCHVARYCNVTCQTEHWPDHKKHCKEMTRSLTDPVTTQENHDLNCWAECQERHINLSIARAAWELASGSPIGFDWDRWVVHLDVVRNASQGDLPPSKWYLLTGIACIDQDELRTHAMPKQTFRHVLEERRTKLDKANGENRVCIPIITVVKDTDSYGYLLFVRDIAKNIGALSRVNIFETIGWRIALAQLIFHGHCAIRNHDDTWELIAEFMDPVARKKAVCIISDEEVARYSYVRDAIGVSLAPLNDHSRLDFDFVVWKGPRGQPCVEFKYNQ